MEIDQKKNSNNNKKNPKNEPKSQLVKNHMNPTPNGLDGKEDNKNQNDTPNPVNYSSFEPV